MIVLREFADNAEWNQQDAIAIKYHQERIAKHNDNLNAWFDYSAFCMRNQRGELGKEGFREIISRKPNHVQALMAHGMICLAAENYEEARVFLEEALKHDRHTILPNVILGLFYDIINEEYEAEKHFSVVRGMPQESLRF